MDAAAYEELSSMHALVAVLRRKAALAEARHLEDQHVVILCRRRTFSQFVGAPISQSCWIFIPAFSFAAP